MISTGKARQGEAKQELKFVSGRLAAGALESVQIPILVSPRLVSPYLHNIDWACAFAALDGYSPQQDPDQFHIQTDEDDERYFLYQTHNGQYRKERRLKDGSVVGTTGWVGADGYLRLQDYIADNEGYRELQVEDRFCRTKSANWGIVENRQNCSNGFRFWCNPAPAHRPVVVNRGPPRFRTSTQAPPSISHTSIPPPTIIYSTCPCITKLHRLINTNLRLQTHRPPITASEASPSPHSYDYDSSNTNTIDDGYYASDSTPYKRVDLYNPNSYRHADAWIQRQRAGAAIGDGYTPQFPGYDGIAFRRNGFSTIFRNNTTKKKTAVRMKELEVSVTSIPLVSEE
ncbi:hypothetical protein MSG28_007496 [Choristoneura fumiferana]|uniref:Uncharacterized protein n=1 Tax=Choristoneura fumiferana TaxID=7141 RepID=A0ACC0JXJ2_CHOFU|nr:hypothetical protein MSG28_007496 [Choristoneura fumiferana]